MQLGGHLAGSVGGVDGRDRPARDGGAVEDDRVLGHVRRHDPEGVAGVEATGHERPCEAVDGVVQLGERVAGGTVDGGDGDPIGHRIDGPKHMGRDRRRRDLDDRQRTFVNQHPEPRGKS